MNSTGYFKFSKAPRLSTFVIAFSILMFGERVYFEQGLAKNKPGSTENNHNPESSFVSSGKGLS